MSIDLTGISTARLEQAIETLLAEIDPSDDLRICVEEYLRIVRNARTAKAP